MKALVAANAFFKFAPDPKRPRNDSFLVAVYDSIVLKRFKRMFMKIKAQGGSITEDITNEAIRKRRNRLAQVCKEFADANDEDLNNGGYKIKTKFFHSDFRIWFIASLTTDG
ncbi:hypothetical protein BT69DRAFT_1333959 [Atractiella rhizophila]|nr:hypothetical protein BT69DRAFT_1333959 [Atractiella rhizophila]